MLYAIRCYGTLRSSVIWYITPTEKGREICDREFTSGTEGESNFEDDYNFNRDGGD